MFSLKKCLKLLLSILYLLAGSAVYSQIPAIEWQKSFGGSGTDAGNCIIQTLDGGYISVGSTGSADVDIPGSHSNTGSDDGWAIKMDASGTVEWKTCLGGSAVDRAYAVIQSADGGYVIAGETNSTDGDVINVNTFATCWIIKLGSTGTIVWQKTFGGYGQSIANDIKQTADGGFIISATTSAADGDATFNHGGNDVWLIKITSTGSIEWQKCYGGTRNEYSKQVLITAGGDFVIVGGTASADGDVTDYHEGIDYGLFTRYRTDAWILKVNKTGALLWQKTMGGTGWDAGYSIAEANDGGYVFTGYTQSTDGNVTVPTAGTGEISIWNVKLSSTGSVLWQKNYGGIQTQQGNSIKGTADGGFIIAAEALPNPLANPGNISCNTLGVQDFWLIKTDADGNLLWEQTYGSNLNDFPYSVQETTDGGYIVAGVGAENSGDVINKHFNDIWIVKLKTGQLAVSVKATDSIICSGSLVTFTAVASFTGNQPTFQWVKNGVSVGTNTDTYSASDLKNSDTVYCLVSATTACNSGVVKTITSNKVIIAVVTTAQSSINISTGDTSICEAATATFTATALNVSPNAVYSWQINDKVVPGAITNTFSSSVLKSQDQVICNLIQPNSSCYQKVSDTISIRVSSRLQPAVSISTITSSFCNGSTAEFVATPQNGGTSPLYQWKINDSITGVTGPVFRTSTLRNGDSVSCILLSSATCITVAASTSNKIGVTVNPTLLPAISISTTTSFPVCSGTSALFTASLTNGGTSPRLQWLVNDTASGSGTNSFSSSVLRNGDIVKCILKSDSSNACILPGSYTSNPIVATIITSITPIITITASTTGACKNSPVTFQATVQPAAASPVYQWKLNGSDAGGNSPVFTSALLNNGDTVLCSYNSGETCQATSVESNVIKMVVYDLPVITITASGYEIEAGKSVTLNATVSGDVKNFEWEPASSLIDKNILQPTTVPLDTSTLFTLKVVNSFGCESIAKVNISVLKKFYMPSAFSPNGDGINDIYRIPPGVDFKLNEFLIYDRWSNLIFRSRNSKEGWNGKIKGEDASIGGYVYIIRGTTTKGNVFMKGNFVLVR